MRRNLDWAKNNSSYNINQISSIQQKGSRENLNVTNHHLDQINFFFALVVSNVDFVAFANNAKIKQTKTCNLRELTVGTEWKITSELSLRGMCDSAIGLSHCGAYTFRGQLGKPWIKKIKQETGANKELNKHSKIIETNQWVQCRKTVISQIDREYTPECAGARVCPTTTIVFACNVTRVVSTLFLVVVVVFF